MPRTTFPEDDVLSTDEYLLPDPLYTGMRLLCPKGVLFIVRCTGSRGRFDEPLYKLFCPKHTIDGWFMPAITLNGIYSRDELRRLKMKEEGQ